MARVYLDPNESYTVHNNNTYVYGTTGNEIVTLSSGFTGAILDQNTESIMLPGDLNLYTFKQAGNTINVYDASGSSLITTAPVQGDSDGTVLTFSNGSASVLLSGGVMKLGGVTVSTTAPTMLTGVLLDSGSSIAISAAGTSSAANGDVSFNVSSGTYTHNITNFSAGDKINFPEGSIASVLNSSFSDGIVDLSWALSGSVVTIRLSGISAANDSQLNSVSNFNTLFGAGTISPADEGGVVIGEDIDTGTYESPVTFNAGGGRYQFMDDAAVATHVVINEFGSGDFISFVNADVSVYSFSNEGEDVTISYNYLNEGTMNVIRLAGVVSSDALVYDSASFTDAIGFAAFAFG